MVVAGHSYGGYLVLLLVSGHYGLDVTVGVATGVKVNWDARRARPSSHVCGAGGELV